MKHTLTLLTAGVGHGIGEWIMYNAKIPVSDYAREAARFNPAEFDADAWVRLAKEAGQRYIIITTKHHDGFALFQSQASLFNIVDHTPFKRDVMKELAAACRKHGIGQPPQTFSNPIVNPTPRLYLGDGFEVDYIYSLSGSEFLVDLDSLHSCAK